MHDLETIKRMNAKKAADERSAEGKRPATFDRRTENKPWPENGPDKTPPHGDPLTPKRKRYDDRIERILKAVSKIGFDANWPDEDGQRNQAEQDVEDILEGR